MKLAASHAIASLAKEPVPLEIIANYGALSFGPDYVIPTPFDPRLLFTVSSAVAKKAMETGVATRPITDWAAYEKQLKALVAAESFSSKVRSKMMIFLTALCVFLSVYGRNGTFTCFKLIKG